AIACSTARAIACCDARGEKPGSSRANGPSAPSTSPLRDSPPGTGSPAFTPSRTRACLPAGTPATPDSRPPSHPRRRRHATGLHAPTRVGHGGFVRQCSARLHQGLPVAGTEAAHLRTQVEALHGQLLGTRPV